MWYAITGFTFGFIFCVIFLGFLIAYQEKPIKPNLENENEITAEDAKNIINKLNIH